MGKNNNLGLIHIYCGEGKGKTTAAVGLTVRAASFGYKVLFVQFLKSGTSSELKVLKAIDNITVCGTKPVGKFSWQMTEDEKAETRRESQKQLEYVRELIEKEGYDLLVMDEILGAIQTEMAEESHVLELLKDKPEHLEVVMTGRYPTDSLVKIADYVSRVDKVKHPFDKGIQGRKGIES